MAALKPGDDPYRILGVLRGADQDQIKAAHRRLAKRFHPDRSGGDEQRFLAVQEAYQLLADPARRLEWDRRHAPVPSWGAERRAASARRGRSRDATSRGRPEATMRPAGRAERATPRPGQRTATWSAAHVPWWEDFRPRSAGGDGPSERGERTDATTPRARRGVGSRGRRPVDAPSPESPPRVGFEAFDLDAHSRSSGAAWSMAARRHFRRGDRDLPSRGSWRYRGTQVVTGAEARKVDAEETARGTARQRHPADADEPTS